MILSKSNTAPRIWHQTPLKTKNRHEDRLNKAFPLQPSMIIALSQTYHEFSSNGLDLAELVSKQVGNRQIPTDLVDNSLLLLCLLYEN
jgi:hypothetical protein